MRLLSAIVLGLGVASGAGVGAQEGRPERAALLRAAFERVPLHFIQNRGLFPEPVAFYIQGKDRTLFFSRDGLTFRLNGRERGWVVKLDFVDANEDVAIQGQERQRAIYSYFRGPKEAWRTGLPTFARVVYRELWPGIDLVYRGGMDQLKYEFVVRPGADPSRIRLRYRGASRIAITEAGRLRVETPVAGFEDEAPVAHQVRDGKPVAVSFVLGEDGCGDGGRGPILGFRVSPYDRTSGLVIDPALLVYCGYIGGADHDYGTGIDLDSAGHAYVAGQVFSNQATFPVAVGPDLTLNSNNSDAFVAKVDPQGGQLVYCGYIGGATCDIGMDVAVDDAGCAYVTGWTGSSEASFPVRIGPDLTHNGNFDGFVAKVNAQGTALDYCGYIGGASSDEANGIAVDATGAAYVVGMTLNDQTTFPVRVGPDLTYNGTGMYHGDAYVAKVDPQGTQLLYCGYIGGSGGDSAARVAVDRAGHAWITGETDSSQTTFPVRLGPDLTYNGTGQYHGDAFVARVDPQGTQLLCCGYIGGSGADLGRDIALDLSGRVYVTGVTTSDERTFPVKVGPDLTYNGSGDAFVARLDSLGAALDYCGYIGGNAVDSDGGAGVDVDAMGNAYVAGVACSDESSFPVKIGPDLTYNGPWTALNMGDGFVAKVNLHGTGLSYCGYIGGDRPDGCADVVVDEAGNAYVTGGTQSTEATFPVRVGPDLTYNDTGPPLGGDAFVAAVGTVFLTGGGSPRPGGNVALSLHAYEDPGRVYQIGSSLGAGPVPIGPRRLCLGLDPLLVISTSGLWPGVFLGYRGTLDGQGQASASIRIPGIAALIGLRIHTAFITLDPSAPLGIRSISNTFSFTITK